MVYSFKDYLSCRPTEFSEDDILLCESRYIETEKQMKKFKGLKRFSYSGKVVEDEIYYFKSVRRAEHSFTLQALKHLAPFSMCSLLSPA